MNPFEPVGASEREIVTTRELRAPRELVWRVWTDPNHVTQWWGPTGFTTTTAHMDVRVGGSWRYTMHGPDGRDYDNWIHYVVVEPHERLVYEHGGGEDVEPVRFTTTVTFEALAPDRTRVTLRAVFADAAARDHVARTYGAVEGGQQTIARLAAHAEALAAGARDDAAPPFVVQRVVRAPRELVFAVWTQREHLERWFGPAGCTLRVHELALQPEGRFHYEMRFASGQSLWGVWRFAAIVEPERLEFVSSFADASGSIIRAPFDANWPLETHTSVVFEPHAGIGRGTVVTLRAAALTDSPIELQRFTAHHDSMQGGWSATFAQLDALIATL
jgi:uncharacterized protein YndB with AHSA1/START domain